MTETIPQTRAAICAVSPAILTTLTVAVAAVVVASISAGVPARADGAVNVDQVLGAVNASRAEYGAAPLKWDAGLLPGATQWANNCKFAHDSGPFGENLYVGGGPVSFVDAQAKWMGEAPLYNYNDARFSKQAGHFTQAVWKNTTGIAVAVKVCPPRSLMPDYDGPQTFVVARYSPQGNVTGQFVNNVGRAAPSAGL